MIKWAIIGAGGIADRRTIPAILKDGNCKLAAVMDRVPETAKAVGEKYGVPYFSDECEMFAKTDADAVYIGTPVFCHKSQIENALAAGKHVFVEKPITLDAAGGAEILEKAKSAQKQLSVGYMMKYHSLHRKIKELVKAGKIGQVNNVRAQFSCWYPDIPGAWRQNRKLGGGGAIMDLGVHCIELVEFLLDDEIEAVKSFYSTRTFSYEVEDGAVLIFKTKSGVLGHIDVNFNIPDAASQSKLELYGSAGYLIANGTLAQEECGTLSHLYAPQGSYDAQQSRAEVKPQLYLPEDDDLYLRQIRDFCRIVESGKPDYFYAERAVQVQQIVDKIYSSEK